MNEAWMVMLLQQALGCLWTCQLQTNLWDGQVAYSLWVKSELEMGSILVVSEQHPSIRDCMLEAVSKLFERRLLPDEIDRLKALQRLLDLPSLANQTLPPRGGGRCERCENPLLGSLEGQLGWCLDCDAVPDGRMVHGNLRHHGVIVACCERQKHSEHPCHGPLRWSGSASDGSVLCTGHWWEAQGHGYQAPEAPKEAS